MKDLRFTVPLFLISVFEFLLSCTDLIAVWAGIMVWETLIGKLPMETRWSLYVGAFAVISFSNWRKQVQRARAAEAARVEDKSRANPARAIVKNPGALLAGSRLSEKELVPYLDQWVRVSGTFEGTADSLVGDGIFGSIVLENGRRMSLHFATAARDQLRRLRDGQQVRALCQIRHGYGAGVFALENCELISAESYPPRSVQCECAVSCSS